MYGSARFSGVRASRGRREIDVDDFVAGDSKRRALRFHVYQKLGADHLSARARQKLP